MPSDVKYNGTLRVIEVVHTGVVSEDDLRECTAKSIAIHLERGVNEVLIDALELQSFANFIDVYDRPQQYESEGVSRSTHIAIVSPKSAKGQEFIQFYDDICYNRGWTVKQFKTRDDAAKWLALNGSS